MLSILVKYLHSLYTSTNLTCDLIIYRYVYETLILGTCHHFEPDSEIVTVITFSKDTLLKICYLNDNERL